LPDRRAKTAAERGRILRRWFELMVANQEDLAHLMTAEQGKPLAEAVRSLKVGNGIDDGVNQGPLIDAAAPTKVQDLADAANIRTMADPIR
jgi:acyl-CoA reductase-like NAD-dependent aldehyde dehydrogenase